MNPLEIRETIMAFQKSRIILTAYLAGFMHSNNLWNSRSHLTGVIKTGRIGQDLEMNDAKTEPVQGAIFSINMLVGVEGGDCYSEIEVRSWLTNAGFSENTKVDVESGIGQVIGIKK